MGVIGLGRARGCLLGALLLLAVAVSGAPQNTAKPLDGSTDQIGVTLFLRAAGEVCYDFIVTFDCAYVYFRSFILGF